MVWSTSGATFSATSARDPASGRHAEHREGQPGELRPPRWGARPGRRCPRATGRVARPAPPRCARCVLPIGPSQPTGGAKWSSTIVVSGYSPASTADVGELVGVDVGVEGQACARQAPRTPSGSPPNGTAPRPSAYRLTALVRVPGAHGAASPRNLLLAAAWASSRSAKCGSQRVRVADDPGELRVPVATPRQRLEPGGLVGMPERLLGVPVGLDVHDRLDRHADRFAARRPRRARSVGGRYGWAAFSGVRIISRLPWETSSGISSGQQSRRELVDRGQRRRGARRGERVPLVDVGVDDRGDDPAQGAHGGQSRARTTASSPRRTSSKLVDSGDRPTRRPFGSRKSGSDVVAPQRLGRPRASRGWLRVTWPPRCGRVTGRAQLDARAGQQVVGERDGVLRERDRLLAHGRHPDLLDQVEHVGQRLHARGWPGCR